MLLIALEGILSPCTLQNAPSHCRAIAERGLWIAGIVRLKQRVQFARPHKAVNATPQRFPFLQVEIAHLCGFSSPEFTDAAV